MNPLRSPLLRCLQEVPLVGTCKWWAYAYIRGNYPLHIPQQSTQLVINHFFCNNAVPSLESSLYLWDLFFVTESVEGTNRLINVFVFLFLNSLFHILNNTSKEAEGAAHWMTWDGGETAQGRKRWSQLEVSSGVLFWSFPSEAWGFKAGGEWWSSKKLQDQTIKRQKGCKILVRPQDILFHKWSPL